MILMKGQSKQVWINEGYRVVAETGFQNLNVEYIGRAIYKSKSSFYYYFGDKELFEAELLDYHLKRIDAFTQEIAKCEKVRPDFIRVLLEFKTDLFFHRQLRIHRGNPAYKKCLDTGFDKFATAVLDLWVTFFDLPHNRRFVRTFIFFLAENFLMQISLDKYTYNWIDNYILELQNMIKQLNTKEF